MEENQIIHLLRPTLPVPWGFLYYLIFLGAGWLPRDR